MLKSSYKPQKAAQVAHVVSFKYEVSVLGSTPGVVGYRRVSTTELKGEPFRSRKFTLRAIRRFDYIDPGHSGPRRETYRR